MKKFWNFVDSRLTLKSPIYYAWLAGIVISVILAGKVSLWFFILAGVIWLPVAVPTVVKIVGWTDGI